MQNLKFKQNNLKKKPPPRPPPPNFAKYKSKSTYDLNTPDENLIQWSPPNSPKVEKKTTFGGSVSSSFSSSTSSLASSKRSFEFEVASASPTAWYAQLPNSIGAPAPTIIRAQALKKHSRNEPEASSLPMPTVPPPSPPRNVVVPEIPYGIALYNFPGTQRGDLPLQVNDVVVLLRRINSDWIYGKVLDKEGIFPSNFIDIQVPLKEDEFYVKAMYNFDPQETGDLALKPGQIVRVFKQINSDWMYGESEGKTGQFPSNFVNKIQMWS